STIFGKESLWLLQSQVVLVKHFFCQQEKMATKQQQHHVLLLLFLLISGCFALEWSLIRDKARGYGSSMEPLHGAIVDSSASDSKQHFIMC
ncbi:hypothetical protein OFN61_32470, partial [Escherichia coli]|nr:hypothetical protein [Escherichia coli]